MNFHILPDDKYVDTFVNCAEELSPAGTNLYLVRDAKPYRYLKSNNNYIEATVGSVTFNNYINSAKKGDKIFLHFISGPVRDWLVKFKTEAKIGWVYWGNDFYTNMLPSFNHFDPLTQAYIDSKIPQKLSRFRLLSEYRKRKRENREKIFEAQHLRDGKAAASKLSYVFHFMKGDFERIQQYLDCPAEFVYFHYAQPVEYAAMQEVIKNPQPLANVPYPKKIWVGNCGYPWVNHLDSFELIKNIGDDVAVCVPLSYGEAEYTKYVIAEGKRRFGARFIPFTDYLGFDDFVKILYNMNLTVMGHNTPWAMGNIAMLMYFGKRVFIKPELPSYRWFKEKGMFVDDYYSFDPVKAFEPQPAEVIEKNKKQIVDEFSLKGSKLYIKNMLDL